MLFAHHLTSLKCCAPHEWRLRRAAPQHREVAVDGSNGPFMTFPLQSFDLCGLIQNLSSYMRRLQKL
jgi:hypothetical protein